MQNAVGFSRRSELRMAGNRRSTLVAVIRKLTGQLSVQWLLDLPSFLCFSLEDNFVAMGCVDDTSSMSMCDEWQCFASSKTADRQWPKKDTGTLDSCRFGGLLVPLGVQDSLRRWSTIMTRTKCIILCICNVYHRDS